MAQELLLTFSTAIGELALIPATGGVFIVRVNGELVYDRKAEGRFPEMKELKQLVRNKIAPELNLGHSDSPVKSKKTTEASSSSPEPAATSSATADTPSTTASAVPVGPDSSTSSNDNNNTAPVVPGEKECTTCL
ncbi:hypothetical protein DFQ26_006125 [Actinomortierella ambigua]|nr:hypothetical protein DFQ26_006125 [Actinomortierella ambigua]